MSGILYRNSEGLSNANSTFKGEFITEAALTELVDFQQVWQNLLS